MITVTGVVSTQTPFATVLTNTVTITSSLAETFNANNRATVTAIACWTTTRTYVDASASGVNNGQSWDDAFINLQDALALARNCDAITEIWVADGIYYPDAGVEQSDGDSTARFALVDSVAIYGGFGGGESELGSRHWETNVTILSGDIDGDDISGGGVITDVDTISGTNSSNVITASDVLTGTVLDGFTITGGQGNTNGAGILLSQSSLTLRNLTVQGNAGNDGGGLYIDANSNATLSNVDFLDNKASGSGGGVYNDGTLFGGKGDAVYTDVRFLRNEATGDGGALFSTGRPRLTNGIFAGNEAGNRGGAIYASQNTVIFTNTLISGNRANKGGGLYLSKDGAGTRTLQTFVNPTITGNAASDKGGGAYLVAVNPRFVNAIVWGNTTQFYQYSAWSILDHAIVQGGCPADTTCASISKTDPRFAESIAGGSATTAGDFRLLPGSPAIDAADSASAPATDLQGSSRPVGGRADLGAYESQGFRVEIGGGSDQTANIGNQYTQPLTLTVISDAGEPTGPSGVLSLAGPISGAGPTPATVTAATDAAGMVSVTARANAITGTYMLTTVAAGGITNTVSYTLTNERPNLVLSKTVTPTVAAPGETITYTLVFTNEGNATVSSVSITDSVPVSIPVQGVSASSGVIISTNGQTVYASTSNLAAGANGTVTISARFSDTLPVDTILNVAAIGNGNQAVAAVSVANVAPTLGDFIFDGDEDASADTVMGTVIGTVGGDDVNLDMLRYSIGGGNDADTFVITGETGEIALVGALRL